MSNQWKEASVSSDEVWDRKKPLEGVLKQIKSNVGPNESMMYMIETKDALVGVWGSTVIDTKMQEVPVGSEIRIEPLGETKSPKTQRTYMDFKVLYRDPPMKEAVGEDITDEVDPGEIPF